MTAITREERARKRQDALDHRRPEDNFCIQCGGTWGDETHTAEACIAIDELRFLDALDAADAVAAAGDTLDKWAAIVHAKGPTVSFNDMEIMGRAMDAWRVARAAYQKIVAPASAERSGAAPEGAA